MPASKLIDKTAIENFRSQFYRSDKTPPLTHLNNAGLAPIPLVSRLIVEHWIRRFHEEGVHCNDDYMLAIENARSELAKFLGSRPSEIAFFQSTAGGISQFALGMDLKPGDEVVTWEQEYPSNLYPWKAACDRASARLVVVPSAANFETAIESLLQAVTENTRVIGISWIQYQTGAATDLERLSTFARARGIFTVVDIIQGAGQLPFDFAKSGLDAVCGGSHKWLCAPVGVGYLCLREELAMKLKPLMIGALTYGTCEDKADLCTSPKRDALRFEAGSKQVLEILALGESVKLLRETGLENIHAENTRLARLLAEGLNERGYAINAPHDTPLAPRNGFVNFSASPNAPLRSQNEIETAFLKNKIAFARRGPGVRLSPHAFNHDDDIRRALAVLEGRSLF
jgi:selenocysteine lyase/cysteine desulfurase